MLASFDPWDPCNPWIAIAHASCQPLRRLP